MYFHAKGLRKVGPMRHDKRLWPQNRWFPELNPKLMGANPVQLHGMNCFEFILDILMLLMMKILQITRMFSQLVM